MPIGSAPTARRQRRPGPWRRSRNATRSGTTTRAGTTRARRTESGRQREKLPGSVLFHLGFDRGAAEDLPVGVRGDGGDGLRAVPRLRYGRHRPVVGDHAVRAVVAGALGSRRALVRAAPQAGAVAPPPPGSGVAGGGAALGPA